MAAETKNHAGVIAPPPLFYLGFLLLGVGLNFAWPAGAVPDIVQAPLGAVMIAFGFTVVGAAFRQFRKAKTAIEPYKETTALITSGLFRLSRNPVYVAMSLVYAGLGILLDNLWILGLLVPVLAVIRYGVIAREERYLEGKFGQSYQRYRATVRRWL
jgi:protein-S-isoprenylcysteine O-methyltransferase Ste14